MGRTNCDYEDYIACIFSPDDARKNITKKSKNGISIYLDY